jgi:hypothetical protein
MLIESGTLASFFSYGSLAYNNNFGGKPDLHGTGKCFVELFPLGICHTYGSDGYMNATVSLQPSVPAD